MSIITAIVAFDEKQNIGKNGTIPWHFSKDLINFKNYTSGNVCIMGRKTWESLPDKYRPLPERTNIIVSKTYCEDPDGFIKSFGHAPDNDYMTFAARSLEEAVISYENMFSFRDCFIIGGGRIYQECFDKKLIDKIIVTHIKGDYQGDVKFPNINWQEWSGKELDKNDDFTITQYDRI